MVNDPIGDMIARIKNAGMSGAKIVEMPYSRMKHDVASILRESGYLESVEQAGAAPKTKLVIGLKYQNKAPAITEIKRKSKPGLRVYVNTKAIPQVLGGMGTAIISTPQGVMNGQKARKIGIGGELLCEVW